MKRTLIIFCLFVGFVVMMFFITQSQQNTNSATPQRFWQITAVDTVKYSRDPSRDPDILTKIPPLVGEAAKLHVTHIAIDTPYDEEFYPVLKAWVSEARRNHLQVWFRGNFSGWEGWFDYPKITSVDQHNSLTSAFIAKHPDLFADGDIFTPIPEMENGGPGDPRGSDQKAADFNANLVSSYDNCTSAFTKINKQVLCGFFSTNGDIAKDVLTPETVAKIGNVIVIDHYVDSSQAMQDMIDTLVQKFPGSKIVLGEFGAPIPDINGTMTEEEQSTFVTSLLNVLKINKSVVTGVDYWTLAGGSTQLLNDNFTERKVFTTVANYYLPSQLTGRVTDTLGNSLKGIQITDSKGNILAITNSSGAFSIAASQNNIIPLTIREAGYEPFEENIIVSENHQNIPNIELVPLNPNFVYQAIIKLKQLFTH